TSPSRRRNPSTSSAPRPPPRTPSPGSIWRSGAATNAACRSGSASPSDPLSLLLQLLEDRLALEDPVEPDEGGDEGEGADEEDGEDQQVDVGRRRGLLDGDGGRDHVGDHGRAPADDDGRHLGGREHAGPGVAPTVEGEADGGRQDEREDDEDPGPDAAEELHVGGVRPV